MDLWDPAIWKEHFQDLGESSENCATGDSRDSLGFKVAQTWAQTLFLLPMVMCPLPSYF